MNTNSIQLHGFVARTFLFNAKWLTTGSLWNAVEVKYTWKLFCMTLYMYREAHAEVGSDGGRGQSGASLLRLQPRRHTVIRSASVHRSCQLLPPSEAPRCCDACLQTSAVRHQPGCWHPDHTPSTTPKILIVCHEGLVLKKGGGGGASFGANSSPLF